MKKLTAFFTALIISVCLSFTSFAAYYEDGIRFEFKYGFNPVVKVSDDGTFTYSVFAYGMQGMANGDMTIEYDTSRAQFTGYELTNNADMSTLGEKDGTIKSSFVYTENNDKMLVKLFVISFKGDCGAVKKPVITNIAGSYNKLVYDPVTVYVKGSKPTEPESSTDNGENNNPPVYTKGDVNKDGNITPADARLALRIASKLENADEIQLLAADVNGDEKVTASDARAILRFSAGLERFP